MTTPILLTETMMEGTTGYYTFTLDQDVVFLDTLTLTLSDVDTTQVINTRDAQDVLNANGCTVTTEPGPPVVTTVTFEITPADTIILNDNRLVEYRVLSFCWTWNSVLQARTARHVVQFAVENVSLVP